MNTKKARFWTISGIVLIIAGISTGMGVFGPPPWQKGALYKDPQGRFSMEIDPAWQQIETDGSYAQFKVTDPPLNLYVLALDVATIDEAFSRSFQVLGFAPELLQGGGFAVIGDWELYTQMDPQGLTYGLAGQIVGGAAYVLVVKTDKPGISPENAPVMRALETMKIAAKDEVKVSRVESYVDLEALVQKQVDSLAGSASLTVLHQGEIAYTYVYGDADPIAGLQADTQTIYRYGSMTKPVTAAALMQLVEQGLVDLDAWPGEYVPEFPARWQVTVRQLLDHAACMQELERLVTGLIAQRGESLPSLEEIFSAYVKDQSDLACEPGRYSNYANIHYLVLARIIEEVSGESYETYVVDHLLKPLEMDSTHFELVEETDRYAKGQYPTTRIDALVAQLNEFRGPGNEQLILYRGESFSTMDNFRVLGPWGGMLGTPSDLTHFLEMFLNKGRYGDKQILKPETVASMQAMQTSDDGSPLGFGLSWFVGEDEFGEVYTHSGGGPTIETTMRYYPKLDLGVVVMGSVTGYGAERISLEMVSAWSHEK